MSSPKAPSDEETPAEPTGPMEAEEKLPAVRVGSQILVAIAHVKGRPLPDYRPATVTALWGPEGTYPIVNAVVFLDGTNDVGLLRMSPPEGPGWSQAGAMVACERATLHVVERPYDPPRPGRKVAPLSWCWPEDVG